MRNTVGMHRVESYSPITTPTPPHDPTTSTSAAEGSGPPPKIPDNDADNCDASTREQ